DAWGRPPAPPQTIRRGRRVGDEGRGEAICLALKRDLRRALVRRKLAAAPEPDRDAGDGRSRQRKDIRVEVAGQHGVNAARAAPAGELSGARQRGRPREPRDRKLRDRRAAFHARQPRPLAMEAGDADVETRSIEPLDELDHLALGPTWMKARKEDCDGRMWSPVHST